MLTIPMFRRKRKEALEEAYRFGISHPGGPFLLQADRRSLQELDELVSLLRRDSPDQDVTSLGILLGEILVHAEGYSWVVEEDACYVKNKIGIYLDPIDAMQNMIRGEDLRCPSEYRSEVLLEERLGKLNFH